MAISKCWGGRQTETVKRDAVEGTALHQAAAKSRSAMEDANAHLQVNEQAYRKIESDKVTTVIEAKAQQEVQKQLAIQNKAHAISSAEQDAILLVAEQNAKAAEAEAELNVMRRQVEKERLVKEKQINVEADAFLYKAKVRAEGIRATAAADADRVRLLGEAQAEATRLKGPERNHAWSNATNFGTILEQITNGLPEVAKAIATPLSKTDKMVFISGNNGIGGGPSAFAKGFNLVIAEVPEVVDGLTGIELRKAVESLRCSKTGDAIMQGAAEGAATAFVNRSEN